MHPAQPVVWDLPKLNFIDKPMGEYAVIYKLIEILISLAVLVPIFWTLNMVRFHNTAETMRYFIFAVYLSAVYLFVGMPTLQFMRFELSLTLIPFLPMMTDIKNTILNVFLFVPLGLLLPFLWKKYQSYKNSIVFGFMLSLSIEFLQILTYRATDINDIIANTLGTMLGCYIFHIASHVIPSVTRSAREKLEIPIIILSVVITMFFVQPYLATLYYAIT